MTPIAKQIERKQEVRDLYARIKQLNEALGLDDDDWGDAQDELGSAMGHLEIADRILSAPDPDVSERCACGCTRPVSGEGPMRCADCGRVWEGNAMSANDKYEIGRHSTDLNEAHVSFVTDTDREDLFDVSLFHIEPNDEHDGAYIESLEALDRLVALANLGLRLEKLVNGSGT